MSKHIMKDNGLENKYLRAPLTEKLVFLAIFTAPLKHYGIPIGSIHLSFFKIFVLLSIPGLLFVIARDRVRIGKYEKLFFTIIFLTIFQTLLSGGSFTLSHGIYEVLDYFWIMLVLVFFERRSVSVVKPLFTVVASYIIPVVLGLYQSIELLIHGSIPALPFAALQEDSIEASYNVYSRVCSCYGDPSYAAAVFSVAIIITLGITLFVDREYIDGKTVFISRCILIGAIIPMIMTLSGTGFIALSIGILILMFSENAYKKVVKIIGVVALIGLALYLFIRISDVKLFDALFFKLTRQINNDSGILYSRRPFLISGLNCFLQSPIFGIGPGNLPIVGGAQVSSAHCSMLTILAEQGIIAFIPTVLLLLVNPISDIRWIKSSNRSLHTLVVVFYVGFFTIFIQSFGYDLLYKLDSNFCLFLVIIYLIKCGREGR